MSVWLAGLQGEMADCMFFVADGVVRILDPDSGKLLTTIAKGSYFGEFALLQVGKAWLCLLAGGRLPPLH